VAQDKIDLEIVTPARLVLAETVDEVVLPGAQGYFGVLPGHAPFLTGLGSGAVTYRVGDRTRYLALSGGYAEVLAGRVSVMAETCERAEEIDLERASRAKGDAESTLSRTGVSDEDFERARAKLQRALARIQVSEYTRR